MLSKREKLKKYVKNSYLYLYNKNSFFEDRNSYYFHYKFILCYFANTVAEQGVITMLGALHAVPFQEIIFLFMSEPVVQTYNSLYAFLTNFKITYFWNKVMIQSEMEHLDTKWAKLPLLFQPANI